MEKNLCFKLFENNSDNQVYILKDNTLNKNNNISFLNILSDDFLDTIEKPIKIIFEGCEPCPINSSRLCSNSKMKIVDNGIEIVCNNHNCEYFLEYLFQNTLK